MSVTRRSCVRRSWRVRRRRDVYLSRRVLWKRLRARIGGRALRTPVSRPHTHANAPADRGARGSADAQPDGLRNTGPDAESDSLRNTGPNAESDGPRSIAFDDAESDGRCCAAPDTKSDDRPDTKSDSHSDDRDAEPHADTF